MDLSDDPHEFPKIGRWTQMRCLASFPATTTTAPAGRACFGQRREPVLACTRAVWVGETAETLEECPVARRTTYFEGGAGNLERPSLTSRFPLKPESCLSVCVDVFRIQTEASADIVETHAAGAGADELGVVDDAESPLQ